MLPPQLVQDAIARMPLTIDTKEEVGDWVLNAFADRTLGELTEGVKRADFGITSNNHIHYAAQSIQKTQDQAAKFGSAPLTAKQQAAVADAYRQMGGLQPRFSHITEDGVAVPKDFYMEAHQKNLEARSVVGDVLRAPSRGFTNLAETLIGTVAPSYSEELFDRNRITLEGKGGASTFISDLTFQAGLVASAGIIGGPAGIKIVAPSLFAAMTFGGTRVDVARERKEGKEIGLARELGAATLNAAFEFGLEYIGGKITMGAIGQAKKFGPAIGRAIIAKKVPEAAGLLKTAFVEGGAKMAGYSAMGSAEEFFTQIAQNTVTNLYREQAIMGGAGEAALGGFLMPLMIAGPASLSKKFIAPLRDSKSFTPKEQVENLELMREAIRQSDEYNDATKEQMYVELDKSIVALQPELTAEVIPPGEVTPTEVTPTEQPPGITAAQLERPLDLQVTQQEITPVERKVPYEPVPIDIVAGKEREFKEPTLIGAALTSQNVYSRVLGTKYMTESSEIGKQDQTKEYSEVRNQIDLMAMALNKEAKTPWSERRRSRKRGNPTTIEVKIAEALNTNEEAPTDFTGGEKAAFNQIRTLTRSLLGRQNQVRRKLRLKEIPYRTNYFRHVADSMAKDILAGEAVLPPELEYWMNKRVNSKIYNSMEKQRQLGSKLEELYSRDLVAVTKGMAYTALKEIHMSEPLAYFKAELKKVEKDIPASTRKWVEQYVNISLKGQETDFDKKMNNMITQTTVGRALYRVLHPFAKNVSKRPVTEFGRTVGKLNITWALWMRPKVIIRNLFQTVQDFALHPSKFVVMAQGYTQNPRLRRILKESRFLQGYSGLEELSKSDFGKLRKAGMAGYQWSAAYNAKKAMKSAYYDIMDLITNEKHKNLEGWRDPKRTGKEDKDFLYPSEEAALIKEMELAAQTTQNQYIGLAMPGLFQHKTLKPATSLQSWWMHHFMVFHREAMVRGFTGKTSSGRQLPWSRRIGQLRYLALGGSILTTMGYSGSFLLGVLPQGLAPIVQAMVAFYKWLTTDNDRERNQAAYDLKRNLPSVVPGGLAVRDVEKAWSGEKDWDSIFLYNTEPREEE